MTNKNHITRHCGQPHKNINIKLFKHFIGNNWNNTAQKNDKLVIVDKLDTNDKTMIINVITLATSGFHK